MFLGMLLLQACDAWDLKHLPSVLLQIMYGFSTFVMEMMCEFTKSSRTIIFIGGEHCQTWDGRDNAGVAACKREQITVQLILLSRPGHANGQFL
jgi:hypothetical protein